MLQQAAIQYEKPARRRKWKIGLVLLIVVAAVAATIPLLGRRDASGTQTVHGNAAAAPEKPAVMVTVAPAERKTVRRSVDTVGTFQGFEEVAVTPKVGGHVVKLYYDVQDAVRTGDVLLEIDPTDYRLAVDEARKALSAELAKIGCASLPPEKFDVGEFLRKLPVYRKALNVEDNAQRKLKRAISLRPSNAMSQEELEQVTTDYEVAKAARDQVEIEVLATVASARQKQALLATAEQRLRDTSVKVPSAREAEEERPAATGGNAAKVRPSGACEFVVAERQVNEGEMVVASTFMSRSVFRLVIDKKLKLFATVPERYMAQVRPDQDVEIRVEAYPDRVFLGRVKRVSPTVDRLSRTFQVEVHVPNEQRLLRPGGFAKLAIVTQKDAQALAVPLESLVSFAGVNKVFVVRDGKAHAVVVSPGIDGRDPGAEGTRWIEVEPSKAGELTFGMQVITSGHAQLAEDVKVEIRKRS